MPGMGSGLALARAGQYPGLVRHLLAAMLAFGLLGALATGASAASSSKCFDLPPMCHPGQVPVCISPDIYDSHAYWVCVQP